MPKLGTRRETVELFTSVKSAHNWGNSVHRVISHAASHGDSEKVLSYQDIDTAHWGPWLSAIMAKKKQNAKLFISNQENLSSSFNAADLLPIQKS